MPQKTTVSEYPSPELIRQHRNDEKFHNDQYNNFHFFNSNVKIGYQPQPEWPPKRRIKSQTHKDEQFKQQSIDQLLHNEKIVSNQKQIGENNQIQIAKLNPVQVDKTNVLNNAVKVQPQLPQLKQQEQFIVKQQQEILEPTIVKNENVMYLLNEQSNQQQTKEVGKQNNVKKEENLQIGNDDSPEQNNTDLKNQLSLETQLDKPYLKLPQLDKKTNIQQNMPQKQQQKLQQYLQSAIFQPQSHYFQDYLQNHPKRISDQFNTFEFDLFCKDLMFSNSPQSYLQNNYEQIIRNYPLFTVQQFGYILRYIQIEKDKIDLILRFKKKILNFDDENQELFQFFKSKQVLNQLKAALRE